ncbi:MAG: GNAT family N-acetyltransferase [Chloroflexota bacterium]
MTISIQLSIVEEVTGELLEAFTRLMPQLKAGEPAPGAEWLMELVEFPGALLVTARLDGKIIGAGTLAWVYAPSGLHARIEDLVVDESARGQGTGEALTRFLLDQAEESGAKYVALTSNPKREAANKLYRKMGFKKWETNLYIYKFE